MTRGPLLQVGVKTETVDRAAKAILSILSVKDHDEDTIRKALDVMAGACRVDGTNITGCEFHGTEKAAVSVRTR